MVIEIDRRIKRRTNRKINRGIKREPSIKSIEESSGSQSQNRILMTLNIKFQ